jgi:hypothetical protein
LQSRPKADETRPPVLQPTQIDPAEHAWAVTKDTTSLAVLEDFIRQFGSTPYGSMARARLNEIKKNQVAVVEPPARSTMEAPAVMEHFIALAFSRSSGGWAGVNDTEHVTRGEAEGYALSLCSKWAKDCRIVASSTACIGLATGRGVAAGWTGSGKDVDDARSTALEWCRKARNSGTCKVIWSACAPSVP